MKTPRGEISDSIIALANDEALIQKLSKCTSPEEAYALVNDRVNMPFEQFKAEMTTAYSYLKDMDDGLLTEEDLDAVAGGKSKAAQEAIDDTCLALSAGAAAVSLAASLGGF